MNTLKINNDNEMLRRWKIFNELLHSENGTTYREYYDELYNQGIECEEHTIRKDKEIVDKLLQENGYPKILETGHKNKRMFINDDSIDICSLKKGRKPSVFYKELLDMLSHSSGFLTDDWLEEMNIHFEDSEKDWVGQKEIISFEQNMNADDYQFLPDIFKAIRKKQVIKIQFKPFHRHPYFITFHPEYLKQYGRMWYAFGLGKIEDTVDELSLMKIPIDRVYSEPKLCSGIKFQDSGTDYTDYFDEIIGVENYSKRQIERVRIKVKRNMAERIDHNLICNGQRRDKELDDSTYLGYQFDVKINIELMRVIYSYASDIQIVAPKRLVDMIKKELKKTIKLYSQPTSEV